MTTAAVIEDATFAAALTVTAPTGVTAADQVVIEILWADTDLTAGSVSISGFTPRDRHDINRSAFGYYLHVQIFDSNRADMSGIGSWTAVHTGSTFLAAGMIALRVSGTSGLDAQAGIAFTENGGPLDGSPITLPEITTVGSDRLVVVIATVTGASTPSGYALDEFDAAVGYVFYKVLVAPGASGTPTTTPSGANDATITAMAFVPVVPARRPIIPLGAVHRASRW